MYLTTIPYCFFLFPSTEAATYKIFIWILCSFFPFLCPSRNLGNSTYTLFLLSSSIVFSPGSRGIYLFIYLYYFFMFIFIFEIETKHEQGRGRERGRHRIGSRLQALSCQYRAGRGARTYKLHNHDLSRSWTLNRLSLPGAPRFFFLS